MNDKPRRRWCQFSLRQLLLATACFALAFAGASWFIRALYPSEMDKQQGFLLEEEAFAYGWPMFVFGIAAGFGTLCNRFRWGFWIAMALTIMPCLGLFFWRVFFE